MTGQKTRLMAKLQTMYGEYHIVSKRDARLHFIVYYKKYAPMTGWSKKKIDEYDNYRDAVRFVAQRIAFDCA